MDIQRVIQERIKVIRRIAKGRGLAGDNDVTIWECKLFNCDSPDDVFESLRRACAELVTARIPGAEAISNALNVQNDRASKNLGERRDAYWRSHSFSERTLVRREDVGVAELAAAFGEASSELRDAPVSEESELQMLRKRVKELEAVLAAIGVMAKNI